MSEDWAADVRNHVPDADPAAIAGIVRYCGIALRSRDASLVSFSDPVETGRVRENFLKKKLALADGDDVLDAAVAQVGVRMAGEPTKNRVTVYYLLAEHFGRLGDFISAKDAALKANGPANDPASPPLPLAATDSLPAPPVMPLGLAAMPAAGPVHHRRAHGGYGLAGLGLIGLAVAVFAGIGVLVTGGSASSPADVAVAPAVMAEPATTVIEAPDGAGVVAQFMDGKPSLSVYFDTAKSEVIADFEAAAAPLKAWLDFHPAERIVVSGYNDATGNAALNAELSKNRARAVQAALVSAGIPADRILLEKPAATTDTDVSSAEARRVDVMVR
ncbi:DUF2853 family protein [Sandarakinorhabdus sp.]|uniref:DUF2853 family protein n=1 Tax=Sandarakinorhabdus sp. TaxID=1916663 RepID=UPI00286DE343|nr:DUF2853 family protein [Sandarakinorhabdus sp.]